MRKFSKIVLVSNAGIFLEYFDYVLYGYSIPFIAKFFFPSDVFKSPQLLAWGVFSVSFLVRPVGAFIFGYCGDRFGRRQALTLSMVLMGISTAFMGFLPTYSQFGYLSIIFLMICRLLQGVSVSSEYSGSSIYLMEMMDKYKGLVAAFSPCASGLGMIAASLLVYCLSGFYKTEYAAIWRYPFIFSGILVVLLGLYFKRSLPESPVFLSEKSNHKLSSNPLLEILKKYRPQFIASIALSAFTGTATYTIMVYSVEYLKNNLGFSGNVALLMTIFISLIESVSVLLFGWLTDVKKNYSFMLWSVILMVLLVIPIFEVIRFSHSPLMVALLLGVLSLCLAAFDGPLCSYLPTLFPHAYRYSAVSISFNLGAAVIGGLAPFFLSLFTFDNLIFPAFYLCFFGLGAAATLGVLHWKMGFRLIEHAQFKGHNKSFCLENSNF